MVTKVQQFKGILDEIKWGIKRAKDRNDQKTVDYLKIDQEFYKQELRKAKEKEDARARARKSK